MKETHYIVYRDEYSAKLNGMDGTVISIRAEEAKPNGSSKAVYMDYHFQAGSIPQDLQNIIRKGNTQKPHYRMLSPERRSA